MSSFQRRMRRASHGIDWPLAKTLDEPVIYIYRCLDACGMDTVTRALHEGQVPSKMMCMATLGCGAKAHLVLERDQTRKPIWEWFKPTYQMAKQADVRMPGMLAQARRGYLFARKIEVELVPMEFWNADHTDHHLRYVPRSYYEAAQEALSRAQALIRAPGEEPSIRIDIPGPWDPSWT